MRICCNSGFFKNVDIFIEGTVHTNPAIINPYLHYYLWAEIPRLTAYSAAPELLSRYSDWLRVGRSWDRVPVGGGCEIFRNRPDRPWSPLIHLCSGYRVFFFQGCKAARGLAIATHPHLAPMLWKKQSYTSGPRLSLDGLFWGELYLVLYSGSYCTYHQI